MRNKKMTTVVVGLLISACFVTVAWTGQVITDTHRQWAKDALAQEKALEGDIFPSSVAILYFLSKCDRSELDKLRKGLAFMLITDLSKVKKLQVVERVQLQAILEELGLGELGLVAPESTPRIGRLLRAAHVVGGKFDNCKLDKIAIDPGILDMPNEHLSDLPDSNGMLQEIFRMEKEILFDILAYLKAVPKTKEELEELQKPMSTNLNALLLFFRGIEESDQRHYPSAAQYYQAALRFDPNLTPAAEALDELRQLDLIGVGRGLAYTPPDNSQLPLRVGATDDQNFVSNYKPAE